MDKLQDEQFKKLLILPILYKKIMFQNIKLELIPQYKLNTSQKITLILSFIYGNCSMSVMAEQLGLENSSFTTVTSSLIELGYLEKRKHNKDKRKTLVHLTEKGNTAALEIIQEYRKTFNNILNSLEKEEQDAFLYHVSGLSILLKKISEIKSYH